LFYNIFTVSVDQALPADENGSGLSVSALIGRILFRNFNLPYECYSLKGT